MISSTRGDYFDDIHDVIESAGSYELRVVAAPCDARARVVRWDSLFQTGAHATPQSGLGQARPSP